MIDASALAGWLLPDEEAPDLAPDFLGDAPCVAPSLLKAEFANILVMAERRGRITAAEVDALLSAVARLGLDFDDAGHMGEVAALARTHGLTAYDATYLELALRRSLPLRTLDRRLAEAARAAEVPQDRLP